MEFPPEIVAIIREYYQPCFKYFREYKRMLELCAFQKWDALKQALQTKPEKVLPAIRAHETAQTVWLNLYYANLDRHDKYRQDYYVKLRTREITYSELVLSLRN